MAYPDDDHWTAHDILMESLANIQSLEGIIEVEHTSLSPYSLYNLLIRIKTRYGETLRFAVGYEFDEEEIEAFDGSF